MNWAQQSLNVMRSCLGEKHRILAKFYFGLASSSHDDLEKGVQYLQQSIDILGNSTSRALAFAHEKKGLPALTIETGSRS